MPVQIKTSYTRLRIKDAESLDFFIFLFSSRGLQTFDTDSTITIPSNHIVKDVVNLAVTSAQVSI